MFFLFDGFGWWNRTRGGRHADEERPVTLAARLHLFGPRLVALTFGLRAEETIPRFDAGWRAWRRTMAKADPDAAATG